MVMNVEEKAVEEEEDEGVEGEEGKGCGVAKEDGK